MELKNANKLIVFGNAELKVALHRFFVKCETKNCEVLSKNWKKLHLTMLILACTNYINYPENNFFIMKSDTIIISDIKLNWWFIVRNAEEKIPKCCSLLGTAELKNANLANIRIP